MIVVADANRLTPTVERSVECELVLADRLAVGGDAMAHASASDVFKEPLPKPAYFRHEQRLVRAACPGETPEPLDQSPSDPAVTLTVARDDVTEDR